MSPRESLYRLVDQLPENDVPVAIRVLEALQATGDPVLRSLLAAPIDDEPDHDDFDGGLSEARREMREGQGVSHDEVKRQLGIK